MTRRNQPKGATSLDVARQAGVSQSTVSLVFSGKDGGRVTPERKQAVLDAAEQLGYRPNSSARGLKLGTQRLFALVVPNVSNPYFSSVLKAATLTAREDHYATVLIDAGEGPQNNTGHMLESLAAHTFDGLIAWEAPWTDQAKKILPASVVIVDGDSDSHADVFISATHMIHTAIDHLVVLGHQRIVRLGFDLAAMPFRARSRAYRDSLHRHGLSYDARFEVEEPFGATVSEGLTALFRCEDYPTAVVCDDDLLAPLVYRAAIRAGRRIPEDISVVGIGDIELASLLEPPLTTIAIPASDLGRMAVESLFRKIRGEASAVQTVETHLVIRASTSAIRHNRQ